MRFLFVTVPEPDGQVVPLSRQEDRRLRRVLRLAPGARLRIRDRARPRAATARLEEGGRLRVEAWEALPPDPHPVLVLYLAPARGERTEWAAERLFEAGLRTLAPLLTARGRDRPSARLTTRLERLAESACEQSGRLHLPVLAPAVDLDGALAACAGAGRPVCMLHPGGEAFPARLAPDTALLVGPEGGFDDVEVERARVAGAQLVGLGGHVLRIETAAVVATTLALAGAGWLRPAPAP